MEILVCWLSIREEERGKKTDSREENADVSFDRLIKLLCIL